jgi:hypothetical protein
VISVEMGDEAGSGSLRIPDLPDERRVERSTSDLHGPAIARHRHHI